MIYREGGKSGRGPEKQSFPPRRLNGYIQTDIPGNDWRSGVFPIYCAPGEYYFYILRFCCSDLHYHNDYDNPLRVVYFHIKHWALRFTTTNTVA